MSLLKLAEAGDATGVQSALDNGGDANETNALGYTALHLAAAKGHTDVVKALLGAGADAAQLDRTGQSALDWAVYDGHTDTATALLEGGANLASVDRKGSQALHWAASRGHLECVALLLANGADVNAQENDGMTALHWAAEWGHDEIIEALLEATNGRRKREAGIVESVLVEADDKVGRELVRLERERHRARTLAARLGGRALPREAFNAVSPFPMIYLLYSTGQRFPK